MSFMSEEAREAPAAVARFLDRNAGALTSLGERLRRNTPPMIISSARGSSDHAASYFKYLTEISLGIPVASLGPSVVSVYGASLKVRGALCVTISQSGQSPDIVALQEEARKSGALTVALVNVEDSPVARSADICLPLQAGQEQSVAATKSFIAALAACAALVAHWRADAASIAALNGLPEKLHEACDVDWPEFRQLGEKADSLYVVGRGPSLPIAAELALKLKETCALHAEAYSLAEVMHGPLELLGKGFPVLALVPEDAARPASLSAIGRMRGTGANVVSIGGGGLDYVPAGHGFLDPISMVQTAYIAIDQLARMRGRDPDKPLLLKKVTETL